ncbi:MAG: bifunctional (p)ppGpp synthetase/guanosine-3',5'-bis(diphosphate) 3'-pyrophosphohydrolase [Clostridia bacterium]|nr:bifunctional (p)ppGpp synthetase/guanosine-3',5'-bis(diphosphate) 3'-pyrophosphohydrolase [Clostridia bacterium]
MLNKAIIFAVKAHEGQLRKDGSPFILHPLEDASIVATMTKDPEVLAAAVLHDTVEDTDTTLEDILENFGSRVRELVMHETENKRPELPPSESWQIRKKESLELLAKTDDPNVKMLWLGDKLSNMRGLYRSVLEKGDEAFEAFNVKSPESQKWYYGTVLRLLSDMSGYPAYKEYEMLYHIIFDKYSETGE